MIEIISEKWLEKELVKRATKKGALPLKFKSVNFTGVPDRIVFAPGAKLYFAEVKTTGQKLTARQKTVKAILEKLGFSYSVIDSKESLDVFIDSL